jgi:hypothetical protein
VMALMTVMFMMARLAAIPVVLSSALVSVMSVRP